VSEFARATAGIFLAVAPFGALPVFLDARLGADERARTAVVMCASALALLAAGTLAAEPLLDWLDVSPENFQLAAGLIMLPQALHLIWRGRTLSEAEPGVFVPLTAPLLAGPASVAAAMSYGTRYGEAEALGASALVLPVTLGILALGEWVEARLGRGWLGLVGKANGALLVVVAVELIVDGIRSV
jgi:small neutral amino acid transporter SnatA (MarC family)